MTNSLKFSLIMIAICLLGMGLGALAQETPTATVDEAVNLDENVQASDLNVGEPTLLPDSPFYF